MAYPYDEEQDPLTIQGTPQPSGAVIEQAQLQAAPDTAPTPTHEVGAYARQAPPQDQQETATDAEEVQQVASNFDAYARQNVPTPTVGHRRNVGLADEGRIQQRDQRTAEIQRTQMQREEDKRAAGVVRGLKQSGVEIDTDPRTGEQRPKTDDQGRVLYKPSIIDNFHQEGDNLFSLKRDAYGEVHKIPLQPKIDPNTGQKYVVGEDGVTRKDLGVDDQWLARRDATEAGKVVGVAKSKLENIGAQQKTLKGKEKSLLDEITMLGTEKNPTTDQRIRLEAARKDLQRTRAENAPLRAAKDQAQAEHDALAGEYLQRQGAVAELARQDYAKRHPGSAIALANGQLPVSTTPPAELTPEAKTPAPPGLGELLDSDTFKAQPQPDRVKTLKKWVDDQVAYRKQLDPKFDEKAFRGQYPDRSGPLGALAELGMGIRDAAIDQFPEDVARIARGGDVTLHGDAWYDKLIAEQEADRRARPTSLQRLAGDKVNDALYQGPASIFTSTATSLAGMKVGAIAAAPLAAALAPETAGIGSVAVELGGAAIGAATMSGVSFFRLAKDQFTQQVRDAMLAKNPDLTEQEWNDARASIASDANEYGLWEAGPEAASEALTVGIFHGGGKLIGKMLGKEAVEKMAQNAVARTVGKYGSTLPAKLLAEGAQEVATEGITQQGEHNLEVKAGVGDGPARSWTSVPDVLESFQEILGPTIVGTLLQGGAHHAYEKFIREPQEKAHEANQADATFADEWNRDASTGVKIKPEHAPAARAAVDLAIDGEMRTEWTKLGEDLAKSVVAVQDAEDGNDPAAVTAAIDEREKLRQPTEDLAQRMEERRKVAGAAVSEVASEPDAGQAVKLRAVLRAAADQPLTRQEVGALMNTKGEDGKPIVTARESAKAGTRVKLATGAAEAFRAKHPATAALLDLAQTKGKTASNPQSAPAAPAAAPAPALPPTPPAASPASPAPPQKAPSPGQSGQATPRATTPGSAPSATTPPAAPATPAKGPSPKETTPPAKAETAGTKAGEAESGGASQQPAPSGGARKIDPAAAAKMPDDELASRLGALRVFTQDKMESGEEADPAAMDNVATLYAEARKRDLTPAVPEIDAYLARRDAPAAAPVRDAEKVAEEKRGTPLQIGPDDVAEARRLLNADASTTTIAKLRSRGAVSISEAGEKRQGAAFMTDPETGLVHIHIGELAESLKHIDPAGREQWVADALDHELRHHITVKALTRGEIEAVGKNLTDEERTAVEQVYGSKFTDDFRAGAEAIAVLGQAKSGRNAEAYRLFTEKAKSDAGFADTIRKWLEYAKQLAQEITGKLSTRLRESIARVEEVLAEIDASSEKRTSTQLTLSEADAAPIIALGNRIDPADLYTAEEGYGLEDQPHITALYGLDTQEPEDARKALADFGPVKARIGNASVFENDKYDVLKFDITGDDVHRLNAELRKLPHKSDFPDYKPHMTVAYLKKGTAQKYAGFKMGISSKELTFGTLTFSDKERTHTPVALGKGEAIRSNGFSWRDETNKAVHTYYATENTRGDARASLPFAVHQESIYDDGGAKYDHLWSQHKTEAEAIDNAKAIASRRSGGDEYAPMVSRDSNAGNGWTEASATIEAKKRNSSKQDGRTWTTTKVGARYWLEGELTSAPAATPSTEQPGAAGSTAAGNAPDAPPSSPSAEPTAPASAPTAGPAAQNTTAGTDKPKRRKRAAAQEEGGKGTSTEETPAGPAAQARTIDSWARMQEQIADAKVRGWIPYVALRHMSRYIAVDPETGKLLAESSNATGRASLAGKFGERNGTYTNVTGAEYTLPERTEYSPDWLRGEMERFDEQTRRDIAEADARVSQPSKTEAPPEDVKPRISSEEKPMQPPAPSKSGASADTVAAVRDALEGLFASEPEGTREILTAEKALEKLDTFDAQDPETWPRNLGRGVEPIEASDPETWAWALSKKERAIVDELQGDFTWNEQAKKFEPAPDTDLEDPASELARLNRLRANAEEVFAERRREAVQRAADLRKQVESHGFFYASEPEAQKPLPRATRAKFIAVVEKLEDDGVNTPEKVAALLEEIGGSRLRPYTQSIWDVMTAGGAVARGEHDWNAVYASLAKVDNQEKSDAANETKTANGGDTQGVAPTDESGVGKPGSVEAGTGRDQPGGDVAGSLPADGEPAGSAASAGSAGGANGGRGAAGGEGDSENGAPDVGRVPGQGATGDNPDDSGSGAGVAGGERDRPESLARSNYHLTEPERLVGGGPKARFKRNQEALETFQQIQVEQREPTPAELNTMAAYMGWGSFGQELFQGTWEISRPANGWEKENEWLRDHLSKAGWQSAQESIINAHYTDPPTVSAMWRMAERLGFTGGRVLEPSMGVGNFFALMPREMMSRSDLTGIEMDMVVGGIAQMLYPRANVQVKGYQDSKTADNFYDLVIGNWPFAKDGPSDRRYNNLKLSLHDYFFVKALDQVRPGGFVIGITSSGTMDKKGETARRQMAKRAELVASFRLPSGAFEKYAGTKVVTDLIILKKREQPLPEASGELWIDLEEVETRGGQKVAVNKYYAAHPENILGELGIGSGTTFGRAGMIVNRQSNFPEILAALHDRLPADLFKPWTPTEGKRERTIANTEDRRQNAVVHVADRANAGENGFYVVRGEQLVNLEDVRPWRVKDKKETAAREADGKSLVAMASSLTRLLDEQRRNDPAANETRNKLKEQYEAHAAAHGHFADSTMLDVFTRAGDPSARSLRNLETWDGKAWVPRDILTKDIMRRKVAGEAGNVSDAYIMSRNDSISLDLDRVAELAKTTKEEAIKELVALDQIYQGPDRVWYPREEYLGGNVRQKLREALDARDQGIDMERNITALEAIQPKDIPYLQIEVQMGAAWVPKTDYDAFAAHLFGVPLERTKEGVRITKAMSGWDVRIDDAQLLSSASATTKWGIARHHMPFSKILQAAMNGTALTVTAEDQDGRKFTLTEETKQVNAKIDAIREEFAGWLWREPERTGRLTRDYNETLNAEVNPQRSGSHLRLEGLALSLGRGEFDFRQHQKDAVWRFLQDGRGVAFHEVGTGKTFTIAGLAMEGRRLGRFRKPILFAHNANHRGVAADMSIAYPGAKVLHIDNLSPENRDDALRQIALDDWDLIVMPHSLLDRFTLRGETLMEMARDEIAQLETEIYAAAADADRSLEGVDLDDDKAVAKALARATGAHTAKNLVKMRKRIIKRIQDKAAAAERAGALLFEDLGIDSIMVDEAHMFKKVALATRKNLKGLSKEESGRGWMLNALSTYVKRQNSGKGVFLFTGTPLTNNLNEAFTMMQFVMDDVMEQGKVKSFDDWFNAFAQATTDVELTSGGTLEPVTRLLSFVNVPELARMASRYFDVVLAKDMPEFVERESMDGMDAEAIGRPHKKMRAITSEMSPAQAAFKANIEKRYKEYQDLDGKGKRERALKGGDVPILMDGDGAKSAMDHRMVTQNPGDDFTGSKLNKLVKQALTHFHEHEKATQAIFMENGFNDFTDVDEAIRDGEGWPLRNDEGETMRQKVRRPAFNLVRDMVQKLVDGGVDPSQIAVLSNMKLDAADKRPDDVLRKVVREGIRHPAIVRDDGKSIEKDDIAAAAREGKIRFLIGSTQTLGTGVNAQTYMRAMHHLDAPWTPGEFEQRNGRGWRQGNIWNTVNEYRYFTEGSHDGRRWQVLLNKVRFIQRFTEMLRGGAGERVLTGDGADLGGGEGSEGEGNVSDFASSFSTAVGDPRIQIRAKLEADVKKLTERRSTFLRGLENARERVGTLGSDIERQRGIADNWRKLLETYRADQSAAPGQFAISIGTQKFTDRKKAEARIVELPSFTKTATVGTIGSFDIFYDAKGGHSGGDYDTRFSLRLPGSDTKIDLSKFSVAAIEAQLRMLPSRVETYAGRVETLTREQASLREMLGQTFSRQEELDKKEVALAQIKAEMSRSPLPAPAWLRNGVPVGSLVYLKDKKAYDVMAHRRDANGYWLLIDDAGAMRPVRYLDVYDEAGTRIFDPVDGDTTDAGEPPVDGKRRALEQRKARDRREGARRWGGSLAASEPGPLEASEPFKAPTPQQRAGVDPFEPLKAALKTLSPQERKVVSMKTAGEPDETIMRVTGLSEKGIANAYAIALGKLRRASDTAARVGDIFTRALAETPGEQTIGKPQLANPAKGEKSRRFVNAVDEDMGDPTTRGRKELREAADQRLNTDFAKERKRLLEVAQAGGQFNDQDTIIAKKIVAREALRAVKAGNQERIFEAAQFVRAYRNSGTEQARAFGARRDETLTPAERTAEFIGESLLTPPRKIQERMDKDPASSDAALQDWVRQMKRVKQRLKDLGLDLDTMTDEEITDYLKDKVKAVSAVKAIADAKADKWDALYEYWISAILSAPATNVANVAGNTAATMWEFTAQRMAEASVNLFVNDPSLPTFGEMRHLWAGFLPGLQDGARRFLRSWRSEVSVFDAEVLGRDSSEEEKAGGQRAIPGKTGRIVRTPLRLLTAADDFGKSLSARMQVGAEAYRMAKERGLEGETMRDFMREQMRVDPDKPTAAWRAAADTAKTLAFQEELGRFGQGIIQTRNALPGLRYFLPFVKTIANIFKIGVRKSPLGTLNGLFRLGKGAIDLKYNGEWSYSRREMVTHAAEQALAWGVFFALRGLVEPGDDDLPTLTGTIAFKQSSKGQRDLAYRTAPPMSIRIGGEWYSYGRIEPFATAIGVMVDALNQVRTAENGGDYVSAAGRLINHLTAQVSDKTFARGIGDLLNAIEDGSSAIDWAGNFATSWVPNIVRASAREADDSVREQRIWGRGEELRDRTIDRLEYKALPIEKQAPPPKVDLWGREITKDTGASPATDWLWRLFAPVRTQPTDKVADVDRLILNWNNSNPDEVFAPQPPQPWWQKSVGEKGAKQQKTIFMTDGEYNRFLQMGGRMAAARLEAEGLDYAHPTRKDLETIDKALADAHKKAREIVWEERIAKGAL